MFVCTYIQWPPQIQQAYNDEGISTEFWREFAIKGRTGINMDVAFSKCLCDQYNH